MANIFDLSGKVAIVTGANTGIGQALALALAEAGADIAAVGALSIADLGEKKQEKERNRLSIRRHKSVLVWATHGNELSTTCAGLCHCCCCGGCS